MRLFEAAKTDTDGMARVANNIGHHYLDLGEPVQARHWLEHAVELLHAAGDLPAGLRPRQPGAVLPRAGRTGGCRHLLEDALTRATQIEAPHVQACVLTGLADLEPR